ncbi:hypothetical protein DUI87_07598 [Hirundo rustica rustica]|uniref:Uncharacterized protein n=1 Tax=Hirundo rustica rustica TaxID=333673 RepID=A0A3M0L860_HIRRU|nr:hypothetical protein DUI87_07598 [Hirundo rustica rustica]
MLRNQTLHGVVQRLLEEEGKRNKCKTTASVSTQTVIEERVSASTWTVTEEKGTKNKSKVSASTQTVTEEKGTKNKATVSVSTQAVTEEKETKSAISISTQTVTEAEQPKPVTVAPVQKKKSKSKSVCIVTDEDVAGPSQPAEETEPEIITRSLSLGELRDLWREFTRQTNESILTWLLRIWDAAANDTILDGSEARQLGSLSRDAVIDRGIGRTQQTLSLWRRLLTSVRDRYLCKKTSRCTKENGAQWNNALPWSLWQKVPGKTQGQPLRFWSRSYRRSEANYIPTEKEILAAYERLQAASEVIGTETQLLLAPQLPVLGWMSKRKVPSMHHATDTTWSKWIALITQRTRIGNLNRPGILEIITNWPEGGTFRLSSEEEEVTPAEEAPPYNELPEIERQYALFAGGSCRIVGANRKWKAAVWSPTRQVAQATEGQGGSSQVAELKAIQLALDIAEREKWPKLYLYTDSWMVANALWGWLNRWKKANWQRRGKPIWAAEIWQDIAARVEKLIMKVRHVDAHVSKSQANEEHHNNEQMDKAAKVKVSQVDLDWQHKGEVFLAHWAHDASGHQGRDATYRWARDRGVDLTMDNISQVIHNCETCAAIKQAKRVKPLWYGGRWLKYRYGEAWQIDYITLPQTRQGKRYVLTMVEATTEWLETYPVPHATARNTILGLEKQVLWRHGTPKKSNQTMRPISRMTLQTPV